MLIGAWLVSTTAYAQKYEAEEAELIGVQIGQSTQGFSGIGYVTGFDNDGDKVVFRFTHEKDEKVQLYIGYAAPYGTKNNLVYVNGNNLGNLTFPENKKFSELDAGKINLKKGENVLSIEKRWGWFEVDYIRLDVAKESAAWNISNMPVNANASPEAIGLYRFLLKNFGKTTFAGQFQSEDKLYTQTNSELDYLKKLTDKYPAVYGNDLIDYSPSRIEFGSSTKATDDVINFAKNAGGMVTLTWHWNAPTDLPNTSESPWWSGFYTRATTFDIATVINQPESERYALLLRDIDAIAVQLKKLQDEKIPVLWRPLHEAEGTWFWWGAKGPEACKKLWILLYERLTNHHQLNNLIWVWTTTDSPFALDWYPGDAYVDILGVDVYLADGDYSVSAAMFDNLRNIFEGKKMLTMSENGTIPDPDKLYSEEAPWSYFCTWVGSFLFDGKQNTEAHIKRVFNHENITTADELPENWMVQTGMSQLKKKSIEKPFYPNPVKHELFYRFGDEWPQELTLINQAGQSMKLAEGEFLDKTGKISLQNIQAGIYTLLVNYRNRVETQQLIILK